MQKYKCVVDHSTYLKPIKKTAQWCPSKNRSEQKDHAYIHLDVVSTNEASVTCAIDSPYTDKKKMHPWIVELKGKISDLKGELRRKEIELSERDDVTK